MQLPATGSIRTPSSFASMRGSNGVGKTFRASLTALFPNFYEACFQVPPHIALPRSGCPSILKLTCLVYGTNPSTLERERARAHLASPNKLRQSQASGSTGWRARHASVTQ